jgi:hypothetical protein
MILGEYQDDPARRDGTRVSLTRVRDERHRREVIAALLQRPGPVANINAVVEAWLAERPTFAVGAEYDLSGGVLCWIPPRSVDETGPRT